MKPLFFSLAQYKLFKKTADEDKDRGLLNAHKAGLTGALAGLLLGRGAPVAAGAGRLAGGIAALRSTRTRRALAGYAAGTAAVHAVRATTTGTRDAYGDRSRAAKHAEKAPMWAGLAGAGLVARKRLTGKFFARRGTPIVFSVMDELRTLAKNKGLREGAALAGGITAADAATRAVFPDPGQTRTQAAGAGLAQGALYGSVLAGAEPLLRNSIKRAALAAWRDAILFSRQQIINDHWVKIDPLRVASGELKGSKPVIDSDGQYKRHPTTGKIRLEPHDVGVAHAQVLRAAYNQGVTINRYGGRAARLGRDAVGAIRGEKKTDERGRPMKREWEKSWFRNAAGAALIGGGLLANAHAMKRFPRYRAKVVGAKNWVKAKANKIVPDSFPVTTGYAARLARQICFDAWAEDKGWDVRDPRGRSARVFAPGSRRRERREKKTYETVGFLRKAAVAAGVGALALGGAGGYVLGRRTVKAPIIRTIIKKARPGKGALATPMRHGQFIVHAGGAA